MPDVVAATAPLGLVLVVEDDVAVRMSIALLLKLHGYATEEYGSAEQFLQSSPLPQRPACVLADIRLPGMSGTALQARMVGNRHAPPVLLMTAQGSEELARAALLRGAVDFLEKPIDETALLSAVAAGLRSDAERMARESERDALAMRLGTLSRQERLLFEQITDGRQTREIAEQWGLAVEVVEQQRAGLMEKLQAPRMADLFRLRFQIGERLSGRAEPL